ncbi:unnamed protein product [Timema podura]|uniref:FAM69 protein-kinase domain-containing protein n=1 Tax=Timema podura TaxID=61482 RepID=A0ABN7NNZ0_TIMPD|nr:unnamed protein product [Timema podura]
MFWNICRLKGKVYFLIGLFLTTLLWKLLNNILSPPSITELTELSKCPTCFGVTMCPAFMLGEIKLVGFSKYTKLLNVLGSKNVMFGTYERNQIVLKKLGHSWELEKLDDKICKELKLNADCQVKNAEWNLIDFHTLIAQSVAISDNTSHQTNSYSPVNGEAIPLLSFTRNCQQSPEIRKNDFKDMLVTDTQSCVQILPAEEDWPVPKYYGACGRVAVEEFAGTMLTAHHHSPWLSRADMARQLLIAAKQFTVRHPYFRFYLTDVSPDNIAVDSSGRLRFVDLENVIVVDKNISNDGKPSSWDTLHSSENFDCPGCFAFSTHELCTHKISDHNFYAVCQHLLAPDISSDLLPGGLLHDIPLHIVKSHPHLPDLLKECSQPDKLADRFIAAQQLLTILIEVITNYSTVT